MEYPEEAVVQMDPVVLVLLDTQVSQPDSHKTMVDPSAAKVPELPPPEEKHNPLAARE